jgi:hypothetical protein
MENPIALHTGHWLTDDGRIGGRSEVATAVSQLEAWVWANADGTRTIAELAGNASHSLGLLVDRDLIWRALDSLADLGLLTARVTPPGSEPRALHRQVPGLPHTSSSSVRALFAPLVAQGGELNDKERDKEMRGKEHNKEQNNKEQNNKEQNNKEQNNKEQNNKQR